MLNEHQRRRLSVRLGRLVEEGEELLDRVREAGEAGLAGELEALLDAARAAASRLEVPLATSPSDLGHLVEVWSATWWTRMVDCRPEHLRGLGEVDPRDAERLAPIIEEVTGRLARLQRLAGARRGGAEPEHP